MDIASPITAVKGIGEKTQKAFAKMGVYTVGDILLHYPRDYVKFQEITEIDGAPRCPRCARGAWRWPPTRP